MLVNPQVDIALITAGLSIVSQIMQRKFYNKDEMKSKQEQMKKHQERMKELMKKQDEQSKRELESLEKEMMEQMSTMMQGSMKMMMFSMLLFVPAFWFLSSNYGSNVIDLPVPIPWFGNERFIELFTTTNYIGWYVLCSLVFSLGLNAIINLYKKAKSGENAKA